jgi:hypothetical protein
MEFKYIRECVFTNKQTAFAPITEAKNINAVDRPSFVHVNTKAPKVWAVPMRLKFSNGTPKGHKTTR